MIEYNNKIIPDAGKCLKINNIYFLTAPVGTEYDEMVDIDYDVISTLPDGSFNVDNKFCVNLNADTKKNLVKNFFSNDDQIAIILNYQAHKTVENKAIHDHMQAWRDWFSLLIKALRDYRDNN